MGVDFGLLHRNDDLVMYVYKYVALVTSISAFQTGCLLSGVLCRVKRFT